MCTWKSLSKAKPPCSSESSDISIMVSCSPSSAFFASLLRRKNPNNASMVVKSSSRHRLPHTVPMTIQFGSLSLWKKIRIVWETYQFSKTNRPVIMQQRKQSDKWTSVNDLNSIDFPSGARFHLIRMETCTTWYKNHVQFIFAAHVTSSPYRGARPSTLISFQSSSWCISNGSSSAAFDLTVNTKSPCWPVSYFNFSSRSLALIKTSIWDFGGSDGSWQSNWRHSA